MQSVSLQSLEDYEVIVVGGREVKEITAGGITARYFTCLEEISNMLETALDNTKGEFVCFIDSVHCFSPFFAEKMTDMCGEDADMACCGYVGIQRNTLLSQVGVPLMLYRPETVSAQEYMEKLTEGDVVSVQMHNYFENKLYRRSLLEKCRPLAENEEMAGDIVKKLAQNCKNVAFTDEPLLFICME
jgi:hypothetical protein